MTPEETVALTRYVRAICPGQRFDEYTPDAWHDVLAPYNLVDARAAVVALVDRGAAFVAVGEITAKVRQMRASRSRHIHGPGQSPEIPDADPDDITAYLAAVRAQRIRAADPTTRHRPLAELMSANGLNSAPRGLSALSRAQVPREPSATPQTAAQHADRPHV